MGPDRTETCLSCLWWDQHTVSPQDTAIPATQRKRKACRRYPEIVWRFSNEWCGEYRNLTQPKSIA